MTPYAHRRFKGPVGSPLIVSILTLESSASRSRPHRIGRFRRRAILRRFVPHPRKMANMRRLVLAKASHTRPNRRGRLAPLRGVRLQGCGFHKRVVPSVPFKRQELVPPGRDSKPCFAITLRRVRYWRAARVVPVTAIGPGSKFRPDRCRRLLRPPLAGHAPCFIGPPALQKSAPDYRRLHPLRDARLGTCEEKKRPGAVPGRRYAASGQIHDHLFTRIFDLGWTPYSRLRASSVTCASMRSF